MVPAAPGRAARRARISRAGQGASSSLRRYGAITTAGADVTRQAITKHLRVLESAGIVRSAKSGRETLFALQPRSLEEAQRALAAHAESRPFVNSLRPKLLKWKS